MSSSFFRPSRSVAVSHANDPIPQDGKPHGFSRRAGDASPEVKAVVVSQLLHECADRGLSKQDTAHVLAIAKLESGFNPDAAAESSTASGIGQFINKTGSSYGLDEHNRFDIKANAHALVSHYVDNKNLAAEHGKGPAWIYKLHHDGPEGDAGGLSLAVTHVLPAADKYRHMLETEHGHGAIATQIAALEHTPTASPGLMMGIAGRAHGHGGIQGGDLPHLQTAIIAPPDPSQLQFSTTELRALQSLLKDHMAHHGFDSQSLAQAQALSNLIQQHAPEREPQHNALVLHKSGAALASTMPAHEAEQYARRGDSVLALNTLEHIAQNGAHPEHIDANRQVQGGQANARSDLEVLQAADGRAWATERTMERTNDQASPRAEQPVQFAEQRAEARQAHEQAASEPGMAM